jgi:hypothetical protein
MSTLASRGIAQVLPTQLHLLWPDEGSDPRETIAAGAAGTRSCRAAMSVKQSLLFRTGKPIIGGKKTRQGYAHKRILKPAGYSFVGSES